ncbi:MAG: ferredoxin--NADP reductase [Acidobacteriota bacterium]|jgi:NAD(P)H-flavin reductase
MALLERQARLLHTVDVGPNIRHFHFEIPGIEHFHFLPGQWVSMTGIVADKKVTRAYSLASLPDRNRFEICLNKVEDGLFTPFLFRLKPGDSVPTKGPVGTFTLRSKERPAIFVATGTGVVPYRPMLKQTGFLEQGIEVTLLFGSRYSYGLMFREEFEALSVQHENFHFLPTVTRPESNWTGRTGRVQPLLWEVLGDRTDADVYVCGLKEMVDDIREQLKARGLDRKQIIVEKFD